MEVALACFSVYTNTENLFLTYYLKRKSVPVKEIRLMRVCKRPWTFCLISAILLLILAPDSRAAAVWLQTDLLPPAAAQQVQQLTSQITDVLSRYRVNFHQSTTLRLQTGNPVAIHAHGNHILLILPTEASPLPPLVHSLLLSTLPPSRRNDPTIIPGWLIAALTHAVAASSTTIINETPICQAFCTAGKTLNPDRLLDHPVSREYPEMYQIYAEFAFCALKAFRRVDPKILPRLLNRLGKNRAPRHPSQEIRRLLASTPAGKDTHFTRWFHQAFSEAARSRFSFISYQDVRKKLQELETLSMLDPATGRMRRVPLAALSKYDRQFHPNPQAIEQLKQQFFYLQRQSPPLLRDALGVYIQALSRLKNGKLSSKTFSRILKRARQQFDHSCERGIKISALLDANMPSYNLAKLLSACQNARKPPSSCCPSLFEKQLNAFLDQIENEQTTSNTQN